MAPIARKTLISRRSWLLAGLSVSLYSARGEERANVTFDGDNLHVGAPPNWHFLTGKPLQRLKDGATVVYLAQLGVYDDGAFSRPIRVAGDRFAVSYDLWDTDKFSVTALTPTPHPSPNLSASAAEAWCLENLAISASNLAQERRFWLKLEMRIADQRDASSVVAGNGLSIPELVRFFGKKAGADDPPLKLEAGPLRLTDLVHTAGRGPRIG
ncbi:conserved hypothetical protein [Candidatus Sulfopaludibacter sp. SbA3]|nr:conserved hypothetical protein [Candidatus Sulfopaludibacter sp. SbA3]